MLNGRGVLSIFASMVSEILHQHIPTDEVPAMSTAGEEQIKLMIPPSPNPHLQPMVFAGLPDNLRDMV